MGTEIHEWEPPLKVREPKPRKLGDAKHLRHKRTTAFREAKRSEFIERLKVLYTECDTRGQMAERLSKEGIKTPGGSVPNAQNIGNWLGLHVLPFHDEE